MHNDTEPNAPRAWRADLQGLRVVAILLVAAYHVWSNRISGGVDVFLMLSGFFVGGSLWRRFVAGRPPRASDYLKRQGRRLLPTAVTVLAGTAIAFVLITPSVRWAGGAKETLASLLYYENWYLATAGQEYGAADVDTSPWQQFWSMSVQGQFFLLTPLLLAAVWLIVRKYSERVRVRALLWTVVAVTVASFAYAMWLVSVDQTFAYYNTFARLWEFTLGLLLAVLLAKWTPKGAHWQVISWIALLALFLTGALLDGINAFPGPLTIIPIGAGALLAIAGAAPHRFGANRVLELTWVAACGKYAYAFYLWHWPLLVLVTIWRGYPSGWKVGAAVLGVAAVLAVLTYHLIEEPLRNVPASEPKRPVRRVARAMAVACAAIAIVSAVSWITSVTIRQATVEAGDLRTHPGAMVIAEPEIYGEAPSVDPIPAADLAATDTSQVLDDGCVTRNDETELQPCSYVEGDGLRVALFGGSHSEHWFEVALSMAEVNDWTLVPYLKAACPPTLPEDGNGETCSQWLDSAYTSMADGDFDLIITTATRPEWGGGADVMPDTYRGMLERLSTHSEVLGIRDNPNFEQSMPECYVSGKDCLVPLYDRVSREDPTADIVIDNVVFVDVNDLICPDELCRPVVGNRMVFRDTSHLTTSYVETLIGPVSERWTSALESVGLSTAR